MATETFGSILRRLMKEKKITHKALSQVAGVHRTTITDYVNDKRLPPEETFRRIHQAIPDKELYDAYFAAAHPKAKGNRPLIPNKEDNTYNFYKASTESPEEIQNFIKRMASYAKASVKSDKKEERSACDSSKNDVKSDPINNEKMYIAHALLFVTTYFEENDALLALAPTDYGEYKKLFDKYAKYIKIDPYM